LISPAYFLTNPGGRLNETGSDIVNRRADELVAIGIDLGATKVETSLVDDAGRVIMSVRHFTHAEKGPEAVIAGIVESARTCLAATGRKAACIGVGAAGEVDGTSGDIITALNMGWKYVPLKKMLEKAAGLPVFVINDVRAAAWAEWKYGAGCGVDHLACVFVGTGLGGGVVSGGRLLEGWGNVAAEIGHMTIVAGGRRCTCGGRGCLEAYAGGWAIAERAQEAAAADKAAGAGLIAQSGNIKNISAATITQAYLKGDRLAVRLVRSTARYLAAGLVSIVHVLNPQVIILGGGVIEGLPEYMDMVRTIVISRVLEASSRRLRITPAALGNRAGVIGAAGIAAERMKPKAYC
jgi:glucokinase